LLGADAAFVSAEAAQLLQQLIAGLLLRELLRLSEHLDGLTQCPVGVLVKRPPAARSARHRPGAGLVSLRTMTAAEWCPAAAAGDAGDDAAAWLCDVAAGQWLARGPRRVAAACGVVWCGVWCGVVASDQKGEGEK
jgi:hypothetical protein